MNANNNQATAADATVSPVDQAAATSFADTVARNQPAVEETTWYSSTTAKRIGMVGAVVAVGAVVYYGLKAYRGNGEAGTADVISIVSGDAAAV